MQSSMEKAIRKDDAKFSHKYPTSCLEKEQFKRTDGRARSFRSSPLWFLLAGGGGFHASLLLVLVLLQDFRGNGGFCFLLELFLVEARVS
jgi:hypothetical protein